MEKEFRDVIDKFKAEGEFEGFSENGRIYLPDDLQNALVKLLEKVTLPIARYQQWCAHGLDDLSASLVWQVLTACGIYDGRDEKVARALMEIESFPSKKEVSRFQIEKVLADVGDIWPACRRSEHKPAGH